MKVYKCIISGDELFSESYKYEVIDNLIRIKAKYVTRSSAGVDNSCIGANPSAEEQEEVNDDGNSVSGVNVVLDGRFEKAPTIGTKKDFGVFCKGYFKKVMEKLTAKDANFDVAEFQAKSQVAFKKMVKLFADAELYTGVSCDPDSMLIMVNWEAPDSDSDEIPYVYFFESGVYEEKY